MTFAHLRWAVWAEDNSDIESNILAARNGQLGQLGQLCRGDKRLHILRDPYFVGLEVRDGIGSEVQKGERENDTWHNHRSCAAWWPAN